MANGLIAEIKLAEAQQAEIKNIFRELEEILSQASLMKGFFRDDHGFHDAFAKARECLHILDWEPIVKSESGETDFRDKLREAIEAIEIVQGYVNIDAVPCEGASLLTRLNKAKATLTEVNQKLNNK